MEAHVFIVITEWILAEFPVVEFKLTYLPLSEYTTYSMLQL